MKQVRKLTESDLGRIVKKVIIEQEKEKVSLIKKLMIKLKGVSDEQLKYNSKHNLPWDWKGSKEGYYESIEGKVARNGSGSD